MGGNRWQQLFSLVRKRQNDRRKQDQVMRVDEDTYKVASQSRDVSYDVVRTETGWTCGCFDHFYRQVRCKHIIAVEISQQLRNHVHKNVVIEPVNISTCIVCGSSHLKKFGIRHNNYGDIQRFCCLDWTRHSA